jgi:hypothetical protein
MSPKLLILAAACTALAMPAAAQTGGRSLSAKLTGGAQPGPGDPNASGSATVRINPGLNRLCYTIKTRDLPNPTLAHIHIGAAGVAGPPVVTLHVPTKGSVSDCTAVDRKVAQAIIRKPGGYYVNVHTAAFPAGAIRGQLHR